MDYSREALNIIQNKTTLMVSGGGALGISLIGTLERLEELGFSLKKIKKIKGSSVGSIVATAIACGASTTYMKDLIDNMKLYRFRDNDCFLHSLYQLVAKFGLNKTNEIEVLAAQILNDLCGKAEITFSELYHRTGVHLIITYLSMNLEETIYADHLTEPDSLVRDTIVKSSSIPLFYEGYFEGSRNNKTLAVDGGTLDNYSFEYLRDGVDPVYLLGLKMVAGVDMKDETNVGEENAAKPVDKGCPKNVIDYFTRLIYLMRRQAMKIHVDKFDWMSTVKINVGSLTATDFHITKEQKGWLFNQGRLAAELYLVELEELLSKGKYPHILPNF